MFQMLKALSVLRKVCLGLAALTVAGLIGGASQPHQASPDVQSVSPTGPLSSHATSNVTQAKAPVTTTKTETETQSVPYTSTTVNSASLAKGTTRITTVGVDGVATLTYAVTYRDGVRISRELISQTTTAEPITQVTSIGTYVAPVQPSCPNGTYINSAGNTVCSPYSGNAVPAGATARCTDGTYSFSQSRSGTCSHHGGVSEWL